ncbi:hypothetical protein Patl1_28300 [Pistacia atlantica]|uniref:Uncharacterized protein n=1 Tax=Pistacia atlantica TaxID=434234 RepID=A0ACC1BD51_9ROSI|nr:hypothetical protein Patl1_28300 [Pistacia atlantica]
MVGIVVGMVGIVGRGVDGNGGSVTLGVAGMVGNVGCGKDGIWLLGKGGSVGFGRVGCVGSVGNGVEGNGGNVALGKVGTEGNGGNVAFGRGGIVGSVNAGGGVAGVSKRWRAARLMSMLEIDSAINKKRARKSLENAIFG